VTALDEYTDADADLEAKTFEDYVMAKINSIAACSRRTPC
jgi:hypothetical protein